MTNALVTTVPDGPYPVRWAGQQAVVTLPEYIGASDSGPIREQLLDLINRGAAVLIADMTGTLSCDHRGADALLRAYQRAAASGGQLRVAVTAPAVRRILDASGLDGLSLRTGGQCRRDARCHPAAGPARQGEGRSPGPAAPQATGACHSRGAVGTGRRPARRGDLDR
jgi:anti-anti-sigma factor